MSDAEKTLQEIADRTERIEKTLQKEPRLVPDIDSTTFDVLEFVRDNPGCESGDITITDSNNTRILSTLYHSYLIDRDGTQPYQYEISDLGESVYGQVTEQQTLTSETEVVPWAETELTRSYFIVLHLIRDLGPVVTVDDIKDEYIEFGYSDSEENPAVGAALSTIYNADKEYVVRSEFEKPYKYKLGAAGEELIEDHGVDFIEEYKDD